MRSPRIRPDAGFVTTMRAVGPTGGGPCRLCGLPVEKGRRTFHAVCAEHWLITSNPGHVRRRLSERDHGVCGRCGLDCTALYEELSRMRYEAMEARSLWVRYTDDVRSTVFREWVRSLRLPGDGHKSLWEAHHRVAVAEGGGLCELDGYETLCWRCHAAETAALRKRLKRREAEGAR